MTAKQQLDLSAQFGAMAESLGVLRKTNRSRDLKLLQQNLLNEASVLASTSVLTALDELEPHFDAMLSVIRDLKEELDKEDRIERLTSFVDKALTIASAFRAGNAGLVVASISDAAKLLQSARA